MNLSHTEVFTPTSLIARDSDAAVNEDMEDVRKIKILLVKPYQKVTAGVQSPQLGILTLTSCIRDRFRGNVDVRILDMKLEQMEAEGLIPLLKTFNPDVIGMSALNFEAQASYRIADTAKKHNPDIITVMKDPPITLFQKH